MEVRVGVLGPLRIVVEDISQTADARRQVSALAQGIGFDGDDTSRAALAVTELATNMLKHGRGGELLVRELPAGGLEILALDRGPGLADLIQIMRDGYSTRGSAGEGLGAIARVSQMFDVWSSPGQGFALVSRILPGAAPHPGFELGVVCMPKTAGEPCGDAIAVRTEPGRTCFLLVDGLGHGVEAATAAREACRVFDGQAWR